MLCKENCPLTRLIFAYIHIMILNKIRKEDYLVLVRHEITGTGPIILRSLGSISSQVGMPSTALLNGGLHNSKLGLKG